MSAAASPTVDRCGPATGVTVAKRLAAALRRSLASLRRPDTARPRPAARPRTTAFTLDGLDRRLLQDIGCEPHADAITFDRARSRLLWSHLP